MKTPCPLDTLLVYFWSLSNRLADAIVQLGIFLIFRRPVTRICLQPSINCMNKYKLYSHCCSQVIDRLYWGISSKHRGILFPMQCCHHHTGYHRKVPVPEEVVTTWDLIMRNYLVRSLSIWTSFFWLYKSWLVGKCLSKIHFQPNRYNSNICYREIIQLQGVFFGIFQSFS